MKTQSSYSLRCSLALVLTGTVSMAVAGCDRGSEFDTRAEEFDVELKEAIDDDDADTAREHQNVEVLASADSPSAAAITAYSARSVLRTDTLNDGDVVMLRSVGQGYLGCDGAAVRTSKTPSNTDGRLWRVHLTDLDGDGDDEMRFELVDGGYTNTFLTMHFFGFVYCGAVGGIGDAAAWNWGDYYGQNGSVYRRVSRSLVNYGHGKCIHSTAANPAVGASCNHHVHTMFNMEVLDTDWI